MAGFSLADMLQQAGVSKSDTREQIEYLPLSQLHSDEHNFYELSDLDALADNIATLGLQQPIRVRADGDGYKIVSGHRRTAAIRQLSEEDPQRWETVACIVERDVPMHQTASPADIWDTGAPEFNGEYLVCIKLGIGAKKSYRPATFADGRWTWGRCEITNEVLAWTDPFDDNHQQGDNDDYTPDDYPDMDDTDSITTESVFDHDASGLTEDD